MVWAAAQATVLDLMRRHRLLTVSDRTQTPQRQPSQPRLLRRCLLKTHKRDGPPARFPFRRCCHVVAVVAEAGAEEVPPAGAALLAEPEADRAGRWCPALVAAVPPSAARTPFAMVMPPVSVA